MFVCARHKRVFQVYQVNRNQFRFRTTVYKKISNNITAQYSIADEICANKHLRRPFLLNVI